MAPVKRKKVKGPNPLSVRKKKDGDVQAGPSKPAASVKPKTETEQRQNTRAEAMEVDDVAPPSKSGPIDTQHAGTANLKRKGQEDEDVDPGVSTEGNVKKRKRKRPKKESAAVLAAAGSDDE